MSGHRKSFAEHAARLSDWIIDISSGMSGYEIDDGVGGKREATASEKAITFFASKLAEGGSLGEFVDEHDLHWGVFAAWIRADEKRNQIYKNALMDRGALRKERLIDDWWKTAKLKVEKPPEHVDVHRARDALAKAEGLFRGDSGIAKGSVTITFDDVDARA